MDEQQQTSDKITCKHCGLDKTHVGFDVELFVEYDLVFHDGDLNGCEVAKVYAERDALRQKVEQLEANVKHYMERVRDLQEDKSVLARANVLAALALSRIQAGGK